MSQSSTADDPILIVGAGPAGLVAAIELRRRGLPVQIVDKQPEPATTTRAITVHASTLGHLHAAGLADEFMAHGIPAESMDYHFLNEAAVPRLRYDQLSDTRYRCVLIIGQGEVERILRDHLAEELGCHVQWGTELVGLDSKEGATAVTARVVSPTGGQVLHPEWVLGCDGVHSTVRSLAGISWEGNAYPTTQRMTDARLVGIEKFLPTNRIHYLMGDGLLFLCELPGGNTRLIISDLNKQGHPTELTPRAFQNALDEHFGGQVALAECNPPHEFQISQRIASDFRDPSGRTLLLGDATGTHSIAGGLGFNRAVQDAFNLGWKLAMVAKGDCRPSLLDTYVLERRPAAEQVGDTAHLIHRIIMEHDEPADRRLAIAERLNATGAVQRISGLSNSYRKVIPPMAGLAQLDGLAAGDRAPDIPAVRLHDLFSHTGYTLMALQAHPNSTAIAAIDQLTAPYRHLLRTAVITPQEIHGNGRHTHADLRPVHEVYGQPDTDTLCLVRPDGYIGLRCRADEHAALLPTLKAVLT